MLKAVFIAFIFAFSVGVTFAQQSQPQDFPPGMVTSITQTGLSYAEKVGVKVATKVLDNLVIPDQAGKKDTIKYIVAAIKVQNLIVPQASITLQANGQVFIQFLNVAGEVTANWWAKETILPIKGQGTFRAVWIGTTLNALIDFGTANGRPVVSSPYTLCHIDRFNIHITGKGLLEEIAVILKSLFAKPIKALIEHQITQQMQNAINKDLNWYFQTLPTVVAVGNTAALNATLVPPNIHITPTALSLNVRGMFLDTVNPADVPPYTPTALPQLLTRNEMVQIFVGSWVPDSASWIFSNQGKLNVSVTEALMKAAPYPFNTENWKAIAPGLQSKYPNMILTASLGPLPGHPPATFFAPTGITTQFFLGLDFAVVSATGVKTPVFSIGLNLTTHGEIKVVNAHVLSTLSFLGIQVVVLNTLVGPIDTAGLNKELAYIAQQVLLPYINSFTQQGVAIPTFYGIQLTDTNIVYGAGYIGIMSNFQYNGALLDAYLDRIGASQETEAEILARREKLVAAFEADD